MELKGYKTKIFNDIFPSYDAFSSWWNENKEDLTWIPQKITFRLIQAEYRESHIAFDEVGFLDHFFIDLYTYVKEFEETTKAIDDLMSLSDNDIAISGSMVQNIADIPESESSTNVEEVNFVSQQQKMINKKGTLQIKKEQLVNKKAYTVKTFLKRFRHLFIKVLSSAYVPVIREPEGD